jgi:pimeloyl-ACP methyl ester carboxylesterase
MPLTPFFREAGSGPGVVCLHANASTSVQWRALMETLAGRFHVLAADSYGSGRSPAWTTDRPLSLRDEVDLLEPVFARAGDPHVLVGHSYGAAVALVAAVSQPGRVRALAVYEPVLFGLVDAESPPPNDADGIRGAVAGAAAALDAGNPAGAAECFIDFWMGRGAWARMPESRQTPIAASIGNIRGWAAALINEPTPLAAFSNLQVPILFMTGSESPAPSRAVARLLVSVLPQVQVVEVKGAGHMAPITHPEMVNDAIVRFLEDR